MWIRAHSWHIPEAAANPLRCYGRYIRKRFGMYFSGASWFLVALSFSTTSLNSYRADCRVTIALRRGVEMNNDASVTHERRSEQRTRTSDPMVIWLKLDRPVPAQVVDRSQRGTGLLISAVHDVTPGTSIQVGLGVRGRRATIMAVDRCGYGRQRLSVALSADCWPPRRESNARVTAATCPVALDNVGAEIAFASSQ